MKIRETSRPRGTVTIISFDQKYAGSYEEFLSNIIDFRRGTVSLTLLEELKGEGVILDYVRNRNLIVNVGKTQFASLVTGVNSVYFNYVGVGSGTTTPAATDTDLTGPYIGTRLAVSSGYVISPNKAKWDTYFGPAANQGTWYEAGLFNNGTVGSGSMAAHILVNPTSGFVKGNASAVLDWELDF